MAERGRGRVQNLAMAMADRRLWPDGSIIGLAMAERCGRGLATPGLPGVAMAAAPPNHMAGVARRCSAPWPSAAGACQSGHSEAMATADPCVYGPMAQSSA